MQYSTVYHITFHYITVHSSTLHYMTWHYTTQYNIALHPTHHNIALHPHVYIYNMYIYIICMYIYNTPRKKPCSYWLLGWMGETTPLMTEIAGHALLVAPVWSSPHARGRWRFQLLRTGLLRCELGGDEPKKGKKGWLWGNCQTHHALMVVYEIRYTSVWEDVNSLLNGWLLR